MYIRKSTRNYKGKTYTNYLLVESVQTPKGPRQRTICSLGNLAPGPPEQWLSLAHRLEAALQGQRSLDASAGEFEAVLERARGNMGRRRRARRAAGAVLEVDTERVEVEQAREAGPVHVGHQMWERLGLDEILRRAGLSDRACTLSEVMTLNRLIDPSSELAMPDWVRRTALGDILGTDFTELNEDHLYRNLDVLHPNRETIERELAERERTLFNLDETIYLYDLTSTTLRGRRRRTGRRSGGTRATSGRTASRWWSGWFWTGMVFRRRTRCSTATRRIGRRSGRCWTRSRGAAPARRR